MQDNNTFQYYGKLLLDKTRMIIFRLNDLNFKKGRLKREGKDVENL